MTGAIVEIRINELEADTTTEQTVKELITDMLELPPAAYVESMTQLCLRLLDMAQSSTESEPKTMKDLIE